MSKVAVLVVEDFDPFRRFVCSTLGKRPELQIVGEASDGLEALHKAEELQPDLILLDIGLPSLNGIEAAQRIRELSPRSEILFVSQESSVDVVQKALSLGAAGYIAKVDAGSELLAAVEAVRQGRQFISSGLSGHDFTPTNEISRAHEVEFYSDDEAFVVGFADRIEAALVAGNALIVVATESHRKSLLAKLQEQGVNINAAIEQGRYLALDVDDTLSTFMGDELPDPVRFFRVVDDLIAAAARSTSGEKSRITICGECASILWAQGNADAAIQLEQFCNQLTKRYEIDILCGFSMSSFYCDEDKQVFQKICSAR
ncbi:MAG TPA: response regulator [Terriglobales bacterium]|nr:response regulator [Terriglobales bacterium]